MYHRKTLVIVCLTLVVLLLPLLAGCTNRQDTALPDGLSESMTYKAFIKDTQADNYSYVKHNVRDVSRKTFSWAQELMAAEEKVRDMRFLMYSGFNVGIDGKSDNYWISGYSESFELVYYLHVEDGVGTVYEVRKPTETIFSSIDSTGKMKNSEEIISEAISRGGECPEGVILEFNASRTTSLVGCPGKWKYADITYRKTGGSGSAAPADLED